MARKTVDIEKIRQMVNHFMEYSEDDRIDARRALATLYTSLAIDAGQYRGFAILDDDANRWRYMHPTSHSIE